MKSEQCENELQNSKKSNEPLYFYLMQRIYNPLETNVLNIEGLNTYQISFWCSTDDLADLWENGRVDFLINGCRPSQITYHLPAVREGEDLHIYHALITCIGFPHTISQKLIQ